MKRIKENSNMAAGCLFIFFCLTNLFLASNYTFVPKNQWVFFLTILLFLIIPAASAVRYRKEQTGLSQIVGVCMPLIVLLFLFSLSFLAKQALIFDCLLLGAGIICGFILFSVCPQRTGLKIGVGIAAVFLTLIVSGLYFFDCYFEGSEQEVILQRVESPEGNYTAMEEHRTQAFPGSRTNISVQNNKNALPLLIGTFEPRKMKIYETKPGEMLKFEWLSEDILRIDECEYNIASLFQTRAAEKNYFFGKMNVYMPNRKADDETDTHGGFHGDGERVSIFYLSGGEAADLEQDVEQNRNWKRVNRSYPDYLSTDQDISYDFYCFYDKQTNKYELPPENAASYNYIAAFYSRQEKILSFYELDT